MKILGLSIEGLRKIKVAELDFSKSNLIQLRGRNEAGKSTIIAAIEMLIGGKAFIPDDVIKHGEEKAKIVGKIDDFIIKRIIKKNGNHVVSIEKEGMTKAKPQEFLDTLAGKFLDPQHFSELSGIEKKKLLMKHFNLDIESIDNKLKELESERLGNTRLLKTIGKPEEIEKTDRISISELLKEGRIIEIFNNDQRKKKNSIDNIKHNIGKLQMEKQKIESEIENEITKLSTIEPVEPIKSTSDIDAKINSCEEINKKAVLYEQFLEKKLKYDEIYTNQAVLNSKIEKIRQTKEDKLKSLKFPLPGLSFTDFGLCYNGITEDNWSDSEKLFISLNISAFLAKELKTIFIKRGESLDTKRLEQVKDFAEKNDFQIIIEIVDDKYDLTDDNIIYIEEGSIIKPLED